MVQRFADVAETRGSPMDYVAPGLAAFEGLLGMLQRPASRTLADNLAKCVPLVSSWNSTLTEMIDRIHQQGAIRELDAELEMVILH
jgi:hypothetical protein